MFPPTVQVQFSSVTQPCPTLCNLFATAAHQASLSITTSQSSLSFMSIESVMPSSHLILCCPILLLPQSLPASESFPMSQLFAWGGQSTGVSALTSFPPKKSQGWLSRWTGWISLQSRDSQESSPTPQFKSINSSALSFLHSPTLTSIHDHWKNLTLSRWTFVGNVMSLLFNMLSRLVITFLPRTKYLLISWLQSYLLWFWSPPR